MAPRQSNAPIPTLLLVVDRSLGVTSSVVPEPLARKNVSTLEALPWGDTRHVCAVVRLAFGGRPMRFSRWRLGAQEYAGEILPVRDDAGRITSVVVAGNDCAELHDLRDALARSQDITSSAHFVLEMPAMTVNATPAFSRMWGFENAQARIPFDVVAERVHEDDRRIFARQRETAGVDGDLRLEYRIAHPEQGTRHLRTHASFMRDRFGEIQRIVGTVVDITEHVQARSTVEFLERHDSLTGLLNRYVFIEKLKETTRDPALKASLVLIDIDRFAQINDVVGHAVGDRLLCSVAERLRFLEQLGHCVGRLGADEFACLLLESQQSDTAQQIVDNLRWRLEMPFTVDQNQYQLHMKIGVAEYPADGSGDLLLQNASIALLSAKKSPRGAVAKYHSDLERRLSARSRIERDLAHAVAREQFVMYYQPLIDAASGRLIAAEALLRWKHPDLGLLSPDAFLNVAEESDNVVNIGRWVLERACRDAMTMRGSLGDRIRMNVNVSPRHVQSSALVGDVASALDNSGWNASQLQLEVTEQAFIDDVPSAVSTLQTLRNQGVTVAIDDFGTGYNTLSYLKSYPVSCIKIDRAFVRDAESDGYSRAICRSVTALAESLNMNLIGEGVETAGQASFLRNIGCRELQGFHFGRPVPMQHFIAAYAS